MSKEKADTDPTKRFSTRAKYYNKYRPGYPKEIIDLVRSECGLAPTSIIADIGSGTGILSEMFLKNGDVVYGVEPNKEMREVAEDLLKVYSNFKSIDGVAESTSLEDCSVDLITVGHAFHWFEVNKSKVEFSRILRPEGRVVLIWNDRRTDTTPFLRAYEDLLLNFGTDYKVANPANFDYGALTAFFGNNGFQIKLLENFQAFDFEGLKGRLLSSSYVPMEGHPNYEAMMDELQLIFLEFQKDGKVIFEYDTKLYWGRLE
ncbi:MAG: class I SAM-dependent methyltransferase [Deltaproteobacteria bacterium]|nr:class I SAM-dependent methyltransferase [Deltaproteobacteria bacterium]